MKFIFLTILILWLSFKVAGFVIRMFLRNAGFRVFQMGQQPPRTESYQQAGRRQKSAPAAPPTDPGRHVTDNLGGDYVEFEEVK